MRGPCARRGNRALALAGAWLSLLWLGVAAAGCNGLGFSNDPCASVLPPSHPRVPCVVVPPCSDGTARAAPYHLANGSALAAQQTVAELCTEGSGEQHRLKIVVTATDNNVYTNLTHCQDSVWQDDALEFMAAVATADPHQYIELDLSPKTAFWAGGIHNPTGLHPENTSLLGCDIGAVYSAATTADGWRTELVVPVALIARWSRPPPVPSLDGSTVLRANFYRTDLAKGETAREFSAWSPTMASPPNFHIPEYFGVLVLQSSAG